VVLGSVCVLPRGVGGKPPTARAAASRTHSRDELRASSLDSIDGRPIGSPASYEQIGVLQLALQGLAALVVARHLFDNSIVLRCDLCPKLG